MVGQCTHTLSLPEVFFEARGKVMEMVEHYPSQGKPAKLPTSAVNVPAFTHRRMIGVWHSMVGMARAQRWADVKPAHVAPLGTSPGLREGHRPFPPYCAIRQSCADA